MKDSNRIKDQNLAHEVALAEKPWHEKALGMADPADKAVIHEYAGEVGGKALAGILANREGGTAAIRNMKQAIDKLIDDGGSGDFAAWPSGHLLLPGGIPVRNALYEYLEVEPPELPDVVEMSRTKLESPLGLRLTEVLEGRDVNQGFYGNITFAIEKTEANEAAA